MVNRLFWQKIKHYHTRTRNLRSVSPWLLQVLRMIFNFNNEIKDEIGKLIFAFLKLCFEAIVYWIVYVAFRGDAILVELYLKREKNFICSFSLAVTAIFFISEIILLWSLNLCSRFSSAILWFYSPNFLSSCNTTAVQRPLEIKLTNYKNNNKQKKQELDFP